MTEEEEFTQKICNIKPFSLRKLPLFIISDFLETTTSPLTSLSPPTTTKTSLLMSSSSTSSLPKPGVAMENPSEANTPSIETLPETNIEPPVNLIVTEMPPGDIVTNVSEPHTLHANEGYEYTTRLPKLNLPYFSGDHLMWQTFWDS